MNAEDQSVATIIHVNGRREQVTLAHPDNDHELLRQLQAHVGGYIEALPVGRQFLIVNEEGKLLGLPVNAAATELMASATALAIGGGIVGTAVLLDRAEFMSAEEMNDNDG
jgi:hypothetical protein